MPYDVLEALALLADSLHELLAFEPLRYGNPGEENVVSELHVRLRARFPELHVSNEYNRREKETKHLSHIDPATGLPRIGDIEPDLVVHRIGTQDENLLVIEVKRRSNRNAKRARTDVWKLCGMTDLGGRYAYKAGVHLVVNIPASTVDRCDVYRDGGLDHDLTGWLRARVPGPA